MFCPSCGTNNPDNALRCVNCGNPMQAPLGVPAFGAPALPVPPNYLVQAILVTIFCCLPFGIPAIVFAAQVNTKIAAGDYPGALQNSKNAKTWCWIAFGVGALQYLAFAAYALIVIGIAASAQATKH